MTLRIINQEAFEVYVRNAIKSKTTKKHKISCTIMTTEKKKIIKNIFTITPYYYPEKMLTLVFSNDPEIVGSISIQCNVVSLSITNSSFEQFLEKMKELLQEKLKS